jgi:hypothetical protein
MAVTMKGGTDNKKARGEQLKQFHCPRQAIRQVLRKFATSIGGNLTKLPTQYIFEFSTA